jgi:penicillin-binding protein 1C
VTRVLKWIASTASALTLLAGLAWLESPAVPAFAAVRAAYRPSDGALVDRHGEVLQEVRLDASIRRLAWTPLAEVSPALVEAVIHAEDRRFYVHGGIDVRALVAAAVAWIRGGRTRGASTLTMQLVTLIDRDRLARTHPRSLFVKLRQLRFASALESSWSKPEILEAYLNLVDFRGELEGVGAASALIYGKAPHGLDAAEAVVLASLLPSPNAAAEAVRARALALAAAIPGASERLDPALADALAKPRGKEARIALSPHAALRVRSRFAGGRFVGSTLDAAVQRVAVDALRRQLLAIQDRHASDGAALVVDNASGDVLAYVGSSGSLSSARQVDGIRSPRQAGSALKPFLYGLAFDERLLSPASLLEDEPLEVPAVNGVYRPENYDERFHGLVSVRNALGASLNVPAVRTVLLVGVDRFAAELRDLGFARVVEDGEFYGPALALGSVEVTLWEMVAAYRALALGGTWSPIRMVPDGSAAPSRRVLSSPAAFLVTSILADRDAREVLRHARISRRDRAGRRHDARRLDVHRTSTFIRQRESLRRCEVQVDLALLIEIERVAAGHAEIEPVVEHPAVPVQVGAKSARCLIAGIDQCHAGLRVGEHRRAGSVRAGARDTRRIDAILVPVRRRRRIPHTRQLLNRTRQTGIRDHSIHERLRRRPLEDPDASGDECRGPPTPHPEQTQ